ncbi:MAG: hypothetical protein KF773_31035 [Deltaproteobacteria bacterium]|nr:hypothetical protein [Deltaproteobacteria bacterium]MCW5803630.1 hypothetical protein [Deltaproteobacteria bacterium]
MRWIALAALAACQNGSLDGASVAATLDPQEPPPCTRDDECALAPHELTCCLECPPAPPFEAVPTSVLAARRIELETDCAAAAPVCRESTCDPVPHGCAASAACVRGACVAVASPACGPSAVRRRRGAPRRARGTRRRR